jgi:AraC-like DNA-binding protein
MADPSAHASKAAQRTQGSIPTIALFEPLRLVRSARARWPELDVSALLALLPAGAADDPDLDRQVPLRAVFDILAQLARRLRQPSLPLLLAQDTRLDEMGIVGFTIMTASSGREAFSRAMRFQRLISAAGAWHLEEGPEHARFRWQRALPLDLGHRLANEIVFAQTASYARQLLGAFEPVVLRLRHPAPVDTRAHREFFGCPVQFGADMDELVVPSQILERTPSSANGALAQYFQNLAEQRRHELACEPAAGARVREWLVSRLPDGEPDPQRVAKRLGMSLRTLQARLRDEGTSFRATVDALRRERAHELFARGENVTSIAFALGFSETSAFSRAFRRWYGHSPREQQRALRAGSTPSRAPSSP